MHAVVLNWGTRDALLNTLNAVKGNVTFLLANCPPPSFIVVITLPYLVADNLPIKNWLLGNNQQLSLSSLDPFSLLVIHAQGGSSNGHVLLNFI